MIRWLALQRRLSGDGGASIGNACPPMTSPPAPPGNVPTGSGNAGDNIGLVGHGFGPNQGTIHVGSHSATVTAWTDTYVEITLPDQADFAVTTTILLTRADGHTATLPAFLTDTASLAAHISSLSAAGGPAGLTVTITGTHFEAAQGTGGVTFHGVAAAVTSWADTAIVVTVPAQLVYPDTGNVVVTTGEGSVSNGVSFETVPNPAITSLSAASARPSDDLALTGTHFLAAQGAGGVTLVGEPAQVVSWADTVIHVIVPDAPGLYPDAGSAIVTTDFGQGSNSKPFTIDFPVPTLFGLSAGTGKPGDSLTLTGRDFEATQGTGGVTIDGTAATVTAWGDTSVTVTVPSRGSYPDTGNVVLTTGHGNVSGGISYTTTSSYALKGAGFEGSSTRLLRNTANAGTGGALLPTDGFSVAVWIKLAAGGGWIMGEGTFGNYTWVVQVDAGTGQVEGIVFRQSTAAQASARWTAAAVTDGAWHLVVFTHAPFPGGATQISVDGGAFVTGQSLPIMDGYHAAFSIGNRSDAGLIFSGDIDEAALWNGRVLTLTDVGLLWNGGAGLTASDLTGGNAGLLTTLTEWWPLNEATGATRVGSQNGYNLADVSSNVPQVTGIK